MRWLHRLLLRNRYYRKLIAWSKVFILPGFGNLTVFDVVTEFIDDFMDGTLPNKATSLSYNFMLAFFPAILFLFTLIPYVPVKNFKAQLLQIVSTIMPTNAYLAFKSTIQDIIIYKNGGVLSFGVIASLYFATNGIANLMRAFNNSSLTIEKRTWLKRRMIATVLTIIIGFLLLISIIILGAGQALIHMAEKHVLSGSLFWVNVLLLSRWIIVVIIFFATISLLYRYGPSHKLKWKWLNPGAIMATALAILTSLGFTFYINHFSAYNKLYGSIGTLIVVMLWLYLNSLILLIGFELNANIELSKRSLKVIKQRKNTFRTEILNKSN
jgi:membrane protein